MNSMERTISNPLIGDEVTFLVTAEESRGEYELVEVRLKAGGGNGLHLHTDFDEQFQAVEGTLYVDCDGNSYSLQPGEKKTALRGSMHRFYNPGPTPITFLVEIRPARQFESTLRIAYGLARDGRVNPKNGIPRSLLETAVLFYIGESYVPGIPLTLQRILSACLYRIARWSGTEARLKNKYC